MRSTSRWCPMSSSEANEVENEDEEKEKEI
jgi:hypothetical protein